jgi:hypothetical protein
LASFEKPLDFNIFLNSSNNLSDDIPETPLKFFFIILRILGLCLALE